jgi:hypothetical protein
LSNGSHVAGKYGEEQTTGSGTDKWGHKENGYKWGARGNKVEVWEEVNGQRQNKK